MKKQVGVILLLMVGGCGVFDERQIDTEVLANAGEIYVARRGGGCLGNCPDYNLYIFDDGRVVFQGIANTAVAGIRRKRVEPKRFETLRRALVRTDLFHAPESTECITDQPAVWIEADFGDGRMTRMVDSGCVADRKNLWPTVRLIDEIAGARMWIYRPRG